MSETAHIQDGILLLRCQQGDGTAFAELVERWQARLWHHAYRVTANRDVAADIVQESWMAVMKGLPRLADVDAFPAWVYRIVTRKATDWVRKRQRRRRLLTGLWHWSRQPEEASPAITGRIESLHDALERLPAQQRALITLYYVEGFTTTEIADIMEIPAGTVKSRLYHARNRIRRLMEDEDNE